MAIPIIGQAYIIDQLENSQKLTSRLFPYNTEKQS
jgi:hypothetical protein